jgi:2-polyprenyl-6-methoxyphenol hydroxylase-like FAD-dependent oxidoreductase
MRTIAIVGSGIAGLLAAHGLLRAGCAVTLYSDRTPEQWLRGARPTGTAGRFEPAMAYERELGLNYWEAAAPKVHGAHIVYSRQRGNQLATLIGRQDQPGTAVDVRLQSHRWMGELAARGGKVVIEAVSVPRLDEIAAAHDLTVVATGQAELSALFARDEARSVHRAPQRHLAMITVRGPSLQLDGVPFTAVKNSILEGVGEAVWIPYYHRDVGPCWNLIFEARPGSAMDVFRPARSGAEALALAQRTIETLIPWDARWAADMELADEEGWLVGQITPTVRSPVARLPSGRVVTCIGDSAMHFDPLAAQGANNGTKMARHLTARVAAHGDRPFDEAWMTATFEDFWHEHGRPAFELTNLLLAPMTPAGLLLLLAQYGSDGLRRDGRQTIADAFALGFADPRRLTPLLTDVKAARRFIAEATGHSWLRAVAGGALDVARTQVQKRLGLVLATRPPIARTPNAR